MKSTLISLLFLTLPLAMSARSLEETRALAFYALGYVNGRTDALNDGNREPMDVPTGLVLVSENASLSKGSATLFAWKESIVTVYADKLYISTEMKNEFTQFYEFSIIQGNVRFVRRFTEHYSRSE